MRIKWNLQSILALILVVLAGISLLLDAAGIVQVWILREPVTQDAIRTLDLLNSTLDTTAQGLGIAKASLKSVQATIGALQATVNSAAASIDSASGAVTSLSGIIGTSLSNTVNSALGTLNTVKSTTQSMDEFLLGLSQIPLLGIKYDPANSLSGGISKLTDQLGTVPSSLSDLEKNLTTSGSSLDVVGDDAKMLAGNLGQVQQDLSELVGVVEQYETQVKSFQETVRNLRANIVTIVWGVVLFLTFILFWIGVTMGQTLLRGLGWMGFLLRWKQGRLTVGAD